jgi:putative holliday junction resolvase
MKYLGVDWGIKKIGLATSEGDLAAPLESVKVDNLNDGVAKVLNTAKDLQVETIVIGKPEGKMGKVVDRVTALLKKSFLAVVTADETLSTQKSQGYLLEMGIKRRARRDDDAVSAAIILQQYLDDQN